MGGRCGEMDVGEVWRGGARAVRGETCVTRSEARFILHTLLFADWSGTSILVDDDKHSASNPPVMHHQSVGPIHPSSFSWHCPHAHANPREAAYRRPVQSKKADLPETGDNGSRQRIGGLRCTTVLDPRSQQMGAKKKVCRVFPQSRPAGLSC